MADVFVLTKAPITSRSQLCFRLMESSQNAKLYLVGDGVYHLLNISALPKTTEGTVVCKEDALARGVLITDEIAVPDDFYGKLIKDMMENSDKVYVF